MEDILNTYALPYDPKTPLICMDERPFQLLDDVIKPLPMKPGRIKGWRHIEATKQRTRIDWAHQVEQLLMVHYPEAEKIRLVMDNLNTHTLGSSYQAFPAEKARSLASLS